MLPGDEVYNKLCEVSTVRCAEALRLERHLKQCQAVLDEMRRRLEREIGRLPRREYSALSERVDQAAQVVQQATVAIEAHLREHSCLAKGVAR